MSVNQYATETAAMEFAQRLTFVLVTTASSWTRGIIYLVSHSASPSASMRRALHRTHALASLAIIKQKVIGAVNHIATVAITETAWLRILVNATQGIQRM